MFNDHFNIKRVQREVKHFVYSLLLNLYTLTFISFAEHLRESSTLAYTHFSPDLDILLSL